MSLVWEFYERLSTKPFTGKCKICKKEYSYRTTSTNLKKHLMYKHKKAYLNLFHNERDVKYENSPPSPPLLTVEYVAEGPSSSQSGDALQFINASVETTSDQEKEQIDKKLLQMIILDYQQFSILEDEGFRSLVNAMNPNYKLPNPKLISRTLIPELYRECKTHIMELVSRAENVCITIDFWTSQAMDSYVSLTAHFMLDFKLQSVLLQCENMSDPYTPAELAKSLRNIAREFNINDKITLAVTDTQYIKQAIEENQWPYCGCFLHKLNSVIENAIGVIDFLTKTVKTVVVFFEKNSHATKALLEYQTDFEREEALELIMSVPNRWGSVYYMLRRFLKLQSALQAVISNLGIDLPPITSEFFETIKQVCMVFEPFEEATKAMVSTNYLSASLGIILVDGLKNVISLMKNKIIVGVASNFLEKVDEGLQSYFPKSEIENNMLLGVCTFLDPRFKIHAFLDHSVSEGTGSNEGYQHTSRASLIKNYVLELVKLKIQQKQTCMPIMMEYKPKVLEISNPSAAEPETISIWGKIDRNIAAVTPIVDDITSKATNELDMFLKEEVARRDSCPASWWKSHALIYPNLVDIFTEYCHIVVTSVQCDRVLSKSGNILTERRACLSRKHTPELVFLNANSTHFKIE